LYGTYASDETNDKNLSNNETEEEITNNSYKGINLKTQTVLTLGNSDIVSNALQKLDFSINNHINNEIIANIFDSKVEETVDAVNDEEMFNDSNNKFSNSRLRKFVEEANPTLSFLDLSLTLDEPVEDVFIILSLYYGLIVIYDKLLLIFYIFIIVIIYIIVVILIIIIIIIFCFT
jgi:hypothetical protein